MYTYDPSGSRTVSGTANDQPVQYQGMEKEFTDPAPYYYSGSGQFYRPQLVRSLSETGQTSSSGPGGGPSGNAIGAPSGSSGFGFNFPSSIGAEPENSSEGQTGRTTITVTGAAAAGATIGAIVGAAVGNPLAGSVIGAAVGAIVGGIASVFDLFGGGGSPPTPRQLLHGRHPLYPVMLGVPDGLIPDETCEALPPETSSSPLNPPPLQAIVDNTAGGPGDEDWCIDKCTELALEKGIGRKESPDQGMNFFRCLNQCMGRNDYPEWRPYFPSSRNGSSSNFSVPKVPWWYVIPFLPFPGNPLYEGL
jgi:hypothetical protein